MWNVTFRTTSLCPEMYTASHSTPGVNRATLMRAVLLIVLCLTGTTALSQVRRERGGNAPTTIAGTTSSSLPHAGAGADNPFTSGDSISTRDSNAVRGLVYHKETPDSVLLHKVFMLRYREQAVKIDETWYPVLSPTGVQADRLDAADDNYYLSKGGVGQPHYGIFPTLATGTSDYLMADPNAGYAKRPQNIWLYQTMTPYTTLGYQSSLDKDYQVHIAHTQNVQPGWNLSFDYDLICPKGVYTASGVKNHYLDATTNYFSADSRLQIVGGIIWQSFNIEENGGIADDAYFTEQLQSNRAGVPVRLYNSGTRHRETAAFARVLYNMVKQQPSYRQRDSLTVRTINDTLSVIDTVKLTDTIFPTRPIMLNAGVFGVEANYDHRKRVFADSTMWDDRSLTLFWTNDAYPDYRWRNPVKLMLGIKPQIIRYSIDGRPKEEIVNRLAPFANVDIALGPCTLHGVASMGDPAEEYDYHMSGRLEVPLSACHDSAGDNTLNLTAAVQQENPCVRHMSDAFYNQGLALDMIKSERYEIQFASGEWLDLTLRANHMSHNVWSDTSLTVYQGSSPLWLYQTALTARIAAGWFHLDMLQLVQHSTDPVQMPVPLWASKNSIYAEVMLFARALTLQTGVDLRYHTAFLSPTYDYRTGLFVHQDETTVGNYLWGDIFVNIQVKRASIYLKAGHVNALWETSPNYFMLPHYPGRKFGLYWGINWKFFD